MSYLAFGALEIRVRFTISLALFTKFSYPTNEAPKILTL